MDKSKARILYVEDYPVIQTMYVDVLRSHGFTVDVANDGKQALELAGQNQYNVVLLDLLLPQMTGLEFLRTFRAQGRTDMVVILSDFDNPETQETVAELGVEHYWIKVENTPHLLAERLEHLVKGIPDEEPTPVN